jgi:hypothetical protein
MACRGLKWLGAAAERDGLPPNAAMTRSRHAAARRRPLILYS